MSRITRVEAVQKEAGLWVFTVTDKVTGAAVDVSSATISLFAKRRLDDDTDYIFTRGDDAFTKSYGGEDNVVAVTLNTTHMDFEKTVFIIVKFEITATTDVRKGIFQIHNITSPE